MQTIQVPTDRDREVLKKLREARDEIQAFAIKNGSYPQALGNISYALGYFEGRFGIHNET